jgi:hypothetical protein
MIIWCFVGRAAGCRCRPGQSLRKEPRPPGRWRPMTLISNARPLMTRLGTWTTSTNVWRSLPRQAHRHLHPQTERPWQGSWEDSRRYVVKQFAATGHDSSHPSRCGHQEQQESYPSEVKLHPTFSVGRLCTGQLSLVPFRHDTILDRKTVFDLFNTSYQHLHGYLCLLTDLLPSLSADSHEYSRVGFSLDVRTCLSRSLPSQ